MKSKLYLLIFFVAVISAAGLLRWQRSDDTRQTAVSETPILPKESPEESAEKENDPAPHPDSLPALMEKDFSGDNLTLERVLERNDSYTRHFITYTSEGFNISGILNVPNGDGPFPVIFLNHGYIDPRVYRNGQGLRREQDYLARRGYAVLHSDYRNHAQSDFDPRNDIRPRIGYTEDVLNAIAAVRNSELPFLDKERLGMLGHSMGGGVTLNVMVTKPDWIKAFVLLAPINSSYKENYDRWVSSSWPELAREILDYYGTFEDNPEFWESVSARTYFDRISSPVMLHQGDLDRDVPVSWSRDLAQALEAEEKNITYHEYPGEGHTFFAAQETVMRRTADFLERNLRK